MHSFTGPSGNQYHHNGDYSGEVSVDASAVADEHSSSLVSIPFEDIRALYLEYTRSRLISELESASYDDLETDWVGLAQAPAPSLPAQVTDEKKQTAHWTREFLRDSESYKWVRVGSIYIHTENPWVLARVTGLPVDGSVPFSVWNPLQGYDWQDGAGLPSQEAFKDLYPLLYRGDSPEFLPRP
jgi:hypothetical protein